MLRRQVPAWSPVTLRALGAGVSASGATRHHRDVLVERVRSEHAAPHVQLVDSGTSALALAILAATPGAARPRVALPAWGCYDLMTAADIANAEVVLYDLDPHTLAPDITSFRDALRRRPASVVVAHWFGLPVAVALLFAEARGAGAVCIEDAAQGVGGAIDGRPLGSHGDFGVLSFGRGKGRTGGGGGALLANTPDAADRLQRVADRVSHSLPGKRALAPLTAQWIFARPSLYAIPSSIPMLHLGETIYHPPAPIRAMPEWSAAALLAVWDRSSAAGAGRRAMAAAWTRALAGCGSIHTFAPPTGTVPGWLRYPVVVRDVGALRDSSARRLGVMTGYPQTLAALPVAAGRLTSSGPWPGAAHLAGHLRTLPSHEFVRARDVSAVVRLVQEAG